MRSPGHLPYAGDVTVPDNRDLRLRVMLERSRTLQNKAIFGGLLGVAGAAAVVGGTFGFLALVDNSEYSRRPTVELHDRGHARAITSDVLLATSLAAAASAVIYYFVTAPKPSRVTILRDELEPRPSSRWGRPSYIGHTVGDITQGTIVDAFVDKCKNQAQPPCTPPHRLDRSASSPS